MSPITHKQKQELNITVMYVQHGNQVVPDNTIKYVKFIYVIELIILIYIVM